MDFKKSGERVKGIKAKNAHEGRREWGWLATVKQQRKFAIVNTILWIILINNLQQQTFRDP